MKFYLMRHGEAKSSIANSEPELTEAGIDQVVKIAMYLLNKDLKLTQVYHSKKKRAQQTAKIMLDIVSPGLISKEHNKIAPNDDPANILSEINNWHEDTLITSHLPFVPNLMTLLTGEESYLSSISFEPATLICLEAKKDSEWNLNWFITPSSI